MNSTRYSFFKNDSGAPYTLTTFPILDDGDDIQVKKVKRVLTANDIGTGVGRVGNASGAIAWIVPKNYNVLMVKGLTYRPTGNAAVKPYILMDNCFIIDDYGKISYSIDADNIITVRDLAQGTNGALIVGDVIFLEVHIGYQKDDRDKVNG